MRYIIREEETNSEFGSKCGCEFCHGEKPLCVTYVKTHPPVDESVSMKLTDAKWTDKLEEAHGFATFLEARLMAMMVGGEAVTEQTLDEGFEPNKTRTRVLGRQGVGGETPDVERETPDVEHAETIVRSAIIAAKVQWGAGWNLLSAMQRQGQVMLFAAEGLTRNGDRPTEERLSHAEVMNALRLVQLPWC